MSWVYTGIRRFMGFEKIDFNLGLWHWNMGFKMVSMLTWMLISVRISISIFIHDTTRTHINLKLNMIKADSKFDLPWVL